MKPRLLYLCSCAAALLAVPARPAEAGAAAVPAGARDVLNGGSYWRFHITLRKPLVRPEDFKAAGRKADAPKMLKGSMGCGYGSSVDHLESARPAPGGWTAAGYDDSGWSRSRLAWLRAPKAMRYSRFAYHLRGKFEVTAPASARLYLTVKFRGGAIVHLNGKEVCRKHMPEGTLEDEAPAERYPDEAFLDAAGGFLPDPRKANAGQKARIAKRDRTLGPVEIPARLLRRGINVLAVEVRRAPYHPVALTWFKNCWKFRPWWYTIDVSDLRLQAAGSGVSPNVARPAGVQLWNHDRCDRVAAQDYGDPNEKLRPIRIAAARNGTYLGQVVLGSPAPLGGVRAGVAGLKAAEGGAEFPPSGVEVLYGVFNQNNRMGVWVDAFEEKPPNPVPVNKVIPGRHKPPAPVGSVLPVLVRVRVPRNAKPGDYRGTLKVSASGKSFQVPLELHVADWAVPDPQDFKVHTSIYTSPRSVAMHHKVKMWSEEHWKLMEESWKLLGRAGNELVVVPAVEETQFGNAQSMIRYRRKGGGWEYDFSIFDRYLDLAGKHCGKLDHVALQIWHAGGWSYRKADNKCTVTLVDEAGEVAGRHQVPPFDSDAGVKFWKPLLAAVGARLAKRGMPGAMCVGILSDSTAPDAVLAKLDEAFPGGKCRWMRGCHGVTRAPAPYGLSKGRGSVVLHEFCYGTAVPDPDGKFPPLWDYRRRPGALYYRAGYVWGEHRMNLAQYRTFAERSLLRGTKGIGRICLDYWFVLDRKEAKKVRKQYSDVFNLFPHSTCSQRRPTITRMGRPGPQGVRPTLRFEAMIEGLQDAEAVVFLSEAIDRHAAKIGAETEKKVRELLRERSWYILGVWSQDGVPHYHPHRHRWQELTRRLYDLAAEARKKLGQ